MIQTTTNANSSNPSTPKKPIGRDSTSSSATATTTITSEVSFSPPAPTASSSSSSPPGSLISSQNSSSGSTTTADHSATEREIWEFMTPLAWHNSIASKDSIFADTYNVTRQLVAETAVRGSYDVVVEVGCGTGDVIGCMASTRTSDGQVFSIPCIGLDINREFVEFCEVQHGEHHDHLEFHIADALTLVDWWKSKGLDKKYSKPLVTCVNNTLNIMPTELRGAVIDQMLSLAGPEGLCMVSYWNGNFFSHAVVNYYQRNEPLCGAFDVHKHVDWDNRILVTPTNYSTHWQFPTEVRSLLRGYDVDVPNIEKEPLYAKPHIHCAGLGIFVWFDQSCTSRAKGYYDSDDAQTFYNKIWGENELHVGRYDLLSDEDCKTLTVHEQVKRAEEFHELEFVKLIRKLCCGCTSNTNGVPLRVLDLGCGYGGMLRRLWKEGLIWTAAGCDISLRMCEQARAKNFAIGASDDIEILEESYLQVGVGDASADLVISMDALLHTGPERQRLVVKEAARILRPGGWMIFSDIMQAETVDPTMMQPIYDRINLSKMGTVSNYRSVMEECGFSNFTTDLHSENISTHYGHILTVMEEKGADIGLSQDYQTKAAHGLKVWRDHSPGNIEWGFIAAQKTRKVVIKKD
jgi:SAM-dependent methyltransferase